MVTDHERGDQQSVGNDASSAAGAANYCISPLALKQQTSATRNAPLAYCEDKVCLWLDVCVFFYGCSAARPARPSVPWCLREGPDDVRHIWTRGRRRDRAEGRVRSSALMFTLAIPPTLHDRCRTTGRLATGDRAADLANEHHRARLPRVRTAILTAQRPHPEASRAQPPYRQPAGGSHRGK